MLVHRLQGAKKQMTRPQELELRWMAVHLPVNGCEIYNLQFSISTEKGLCWFAVVGLVNSFSKVITRKNEFILPVVYSIVCWNYWLPQRQQEKRVSNLEFTEAQTVLILLALCALSFLLVGWITLDMKDLASFWTLWRSFLKRNSKLF